MKNNKSLLSHAVKTGIFALTMLSASQAHAESPPEIPFQFIDNLYATADQDANGHISVDEYYKLHTAKALLRYEATFRAMDQNIDGLVEPEEFKRFLPMVNEEILKQQYTAAAGEDGMLDSEEFSVMRLEEQGVNNESLWEFALLDRDHDGQLDFRELYDKSPEIIIDPVITEPPVIMDGMPPVVKPEPPVIMDGMPPAKPPAPPATMDEVTPVMPVIMDGMPAVEKPELPVIMDGMPPVERPEPPVIMDGMPPVGQVITLPDGTVIDTSEFVGPQRPVEPVIPEIINANEALIASLTARLERYTAKLERIGKSIMMTEKRINASTSEKKVARLERRLKRQLARLEQTQDQQQNVQKELDKILSSDINITTR